VSSFCLKGPTDKMGLFSPNNSLVFYSKTSTEIMFFSDSINNFNESITLSVINNNEVILTVEYLDNRVKENEYFLMKINDSNKLLKCYFARGTFNVCLCSFNEILLSN
jgi:hypothetical protein